MSRPAGLLLAQGYGWRAGRCWVGWAGLQAGKMEGLGGVGLLGQPGRACQFPSWKVEPWTTLPGTRHRNVPDHWESLPGPVVNSGNSCSTGS